MSDKLREEIKRILSPAIDPQAPYAKLMIIALAKAMDAQPYLVWSNEHGAWWRANHCGYTVHLDGAGRYSRAEAIAIAANARAGWRKGKPPPEIAIAERDALDCLANSVAAEV